MAHYNFSNVIITCLNFPWFFFSIATFVGAVYVKVNGQMGCTSNYMPYVGMVAGILFLVMSVTGLLGALRKSRKLVLVYLWCVALSFLAVVGMLVFTAVVLSASPVDVMVANREFQLRDFAPFVRRQVIDGGDKEWGKKRNCLADEERFCREMRNSSIEERQRDITRMVGCCLPPTKCGFKSINNGTAWVVPEKIGPHPDCVLWSSDIDRMCYDCESCKAAHVAAYVLDLRGDIMSLVGAIFFHIVSFVAGYFTAKYGTNDRNDLLVHEGPC